MQAVCFFINDEIEGGETRSRTDGADFVAREYTLGVQLKPLQRPAGLEQHKFHRVVWRKTLDYPCISKYYGLFDDLVYSKLCDSKRRRFANHSGIKIGGWPTSVQMSHYPREFDLQIDMTKNYMYGDAGIGYLSAKGGAWYLVFECC